MFMSLVASLPSPSSGNLKIGPLNLHAYGLCIAFAMVAAVSWSSKRWIARGGGPNDIPGIATFALPAGIIGARIYHVITDAGSFKGRWGDAFKIWEGGLGIWGGVGMGVVVGLSVAWVKKLSLSTLLEVVAPTLPLAQAIGRWGNWFNQELFGKPSDLPWAVEISRKKRPDGYTPFETFHPTFLYESLWNLLVVALVLTVERLLGKRLKPGRLFAVYVAGYTFGRFFIERMRTDEATKILGQRVNVFVALVLFLCAIIAIVTGIRNRPASPTTAD
jgi:prolipoprotein diacylglyceryl transferase